jgi:hypothetical protein
MGNEALGYTTYRSMHTHLKRMHRILHIELKEARAQVHGGAEQLGAGDEENGAVPEPETG